MPAQGLYPRFSRRRLSEALADSPVVLIHGPRQCGKTTLAQTAGKRAGYAYVTFDDAVARASAADDPVGFVADLPHRVILDGSGAMRDWARNSPSESPLAVFPPRLRSRRGGVELPGTRTTSTRSFNGTFATWRASARWTRFRVCSRLPPPRPLAC